MTTTYFNTTPTEGIDFNQTYQVYNQSAAQSSTNSPDYPGLPAQLGAVAKGKNDTEWVFVLAGATINLGDVCVITATTQSAAPITTTNGLFGLQVGVAQVAIASGSYGWLQRSGACSNINVAALCAANAQLATTATPGVIDDAITGGVKSIDRISITTTTTPAATVAGTLNFPSVGATLA